MSVLKTINVEAANDAYGQIVAKIRVLREVAAARRAIADALDGAYVTKAIEAKLKALFPNDAHVYYHCDSSWKYCAICHGTNYSETRYITLCRKEEKRVNAEHLIKSAEEDEERATALEKSLETYSETIATFNAIVTTYKSIRDKLYGFGFTDLPYAW